MKKILVVDDDPAILDILSLMLMSSISNVVTARTIQSAKKALLADSYDLVITDVRLSGIHNREGLELLDYIKKVNPSTEVIVMTGNGTDEIKEHAYRLKAYHYYQKPFDLLHLVSLYICA